MKSKLLMLLSFCPLFANATGMAVENQDNADVVATITNLAESKNKFKVPANTICKINSPIMFLPVEDANGAFADGKFDYVISIETPKTKNSIVIDSAGLALASYSQIKSSFVGNVKNYNLLGYCNNNLLQSKNLHVIPHDNESSMPDFHLTKCTDTSNYTYVINDNTPNKAAKFGKTVQFKTIKSCAQ